MCYGALNIERNSTRFKISARNAKVYGKGRRDLTLTRKFTTPLHVYTCLHVHVENIFTIKMSSKKNKSKSKKSSEGESSLLLKDGSNDSFTVTDFIEKGKTLQNRPTSLTGFYTKISVQYMQILSDNNQSAE